MLLTGDPGDPIVGFRHVRSLAAEVGPLQLIHDHASGTVGIFHTTDLVELVNVGGTYGLIARAAAVAMFSTEKPTRNEIEKARRALDKKVVVGQLVRTDGEKGAVEVRPCGSVRRSEVKSR